MKKLKKDALSGFTLISEHKPAKQQTYRVALENGTLTTAYWDGSAFDIDNVTYWADRTKSALKRN